MKMNPLYKPILTSDSRYYIVTGGRGSGKSYGVTWSILMLSYETGQSIYYTRKTMASAETSIIPDFRKVIEDWNLDDNFTVTSSRITNLASGSVINFMGLTTSNGENSAKIKGLSQATIWVLDEAEELSDEALFDKANFSIRSNKRDNKIIMIMNPATKEHFIYKRFFEDAGVFAGSNVSKDNTTYVHTTYLDNIDNLEDGYIDELLALQQRAPKQFEHIVLGGWRDKAEGIIFTNWSIGETNTTLPLRFGYDDGFSPDPSAMVETRVDRELKKIYVKELMYHTELVEAEKVAKIKKYAGKHRVQSEHSLSIIEACVRASVDVVKATKGPGSVLKGVSLLQDHELIVHPDSINLVKELNNYAWNNKKSDTPVDKFNHLIDALRYSVSDLYSFSNPIPIYQTRTTHMRPRFR